MRVSGLLFDLDGVLYDESWWKRCLFQLLTRFELHRSYDQFLRTWQTSYLDEVHRGKRDLWDALASYLREAGLTLGQVDEVIAASHTRRRQLLDTLRPLPGVLPTLNQLNRLGVPMAVLCNTPWTQETIRRLLGNLGMRDSFMSITTSYELGCTKPDESSYRAALSEMDMDASWVAFIGHDTSELAGAKNLGMTTVAVNYDGDAEADIYLEHFDQLLSHVDYLPARRLAS